MITITSLIIIIIIRNIIIITIAIITTITTSATGTPRLWHSAAARTLRWGPLYTIALL